MVRLMNIMMKGMLIGAFEVGIAEANAVTFSGQVWAAAGINSFL